jgi:hypothetical protein
MVKKLFCGLFFLLAFLNNAFAENIYGSEMKHLKYTRNYQEFVDAAENWELVIADSNPMRIHQLSKDLYNAIVRQLSRWNFSVGDLFIFRCFVDSDGGYDVVIRIGKVNNDGSCGHFDWCGWYRWVD